MLVSNSRFRQSSRTTYGFAPGHVFAIIDPDEVLYEYLGHDDCMLEARPLASPSLKQVFTQDEIRVLVQAGKLDTRIHQNGDARRRIAALNPDIESARDLPDEEMACLISYAQVARIIHDKHAAGETSLTDAALSVLIPRVMDAITHGTGEDLASSSGSGGEATVGRGGKKSRRQGVDEVRTIKARQPVIGYHRVGPSTMRGYIRKLVEHDWDPLAIRDHRKGRCGNRGLQLEALSQSIMSDWTRQYLDKNRPTMAVLYKLMKGSTTAERVSRVRQAQGKAPLGIPDIKTFAQVNREREAQGLPPVRVPSLSSFERAIRKFGKFEIHVARHGLSAARRRFKIAGRCETALAAGERVAIDSWRVQLMSLKLPQHVWAGLPNELVGEIGKLRLNATVAICEATKVVLGVRLSLNPSGETSLRTLEMVCRDKTAIARAADAKGAWDHVCTPGAVPTDSGAEFIDTPFRAAVRDIGSQNEIGPAKHPDARAVIERFFQTVDVQCLQHFQGRTFSSVGDKGDYDPIEVANVVVEVLNDALVWYIVDVYLNHPHGGLGGQTPNDAWAERSAQYVTKPPPHPPQLRAVFGFADNRRIQNRGVRFLGLWYRSEELAKLRLKIGQADILMRADLEDLGAISVRENAPRAPWFTVPGEIQMGGVTALEWLEAAAELRRKHADATKLREPVVIAALHDIRAMGLASAAAAGLGPSTMSREDLLKAEQTALRHFGIATASKRGLTFEGMDEAEETGALPLQAATPTDAPNNPIGDETDDGDDVAELPVVRRRGRLGSDFLSEE